MRQLLIGIRLGEEFAVVLIVQEAVLGDDGRHVVIGGAVDDAVVIRTGASESCPEAVTFQADGGELLEIQKAVGAFLRVQAAVSEKRCITEDIMNPPDIVFSVGKQISLV